MCDGCECIYHFYRIPSHNGEEEMWRVCSFKKYYLC